LVRQQHFLNVRTYVRHRDEPGALFFQGWLSRPWKAPVPSGLLGLPYTFASVQCDQAATSRLSAHIVDATGNRFAYQAERPAAENLAPCPAGSLAEFTLERYSGFFVRAGRVMGFRIWHPAWLQATLAASILDDTLIRSRFEWFKQAKFLGANYAPGFPAVSIGRPQGIERMRAASVRRRHVLSSFYEMP
jgi:uncharacterized protein YqjF (DUF2071 family)